MDRKIPACAGVRTGPRARPARGRRQRPRIGRGGIQCGQIARRYIRPVPLSWGPSVASHGCGVKEVGPYHYGAIFEATGQSS